MWSPITGICNTFQRPKSSHVSKHDGPNTLPPSTSSSIFVLENSVPNLMHSLDDGTSILKRGIVTMPVSIHRTTAQYSLPSNWHHPSELPLYQSKSSMDLSSWMLKGSILTSELREDPISTEHLNNKSDPKWTLNPDGLLCHLRCIYVLNSSNLQLCVLQYSHDHPLAGHFGQTKTLHQVHMQYYWSRLPVYVKNYCKLCTTCSHAKPVCHKPYGLLKQLPIPEKPWNSISMYFIEKLPPSSSYTSILVIVDRLSKQSLFIPTHNTITSHQIAQLFVLHVFYKHG